MHPPRRNFGLRFGRRDAYAWSPGVWRLLYSGTIGILIIPHDHETYPEYTLCNQTLFGYMAIYAKTKKQNECKEIQRRRHRQKARGRRGLGVTVYFIVYTIGVAGCMYSLTQRLRKLSAQFCFFRGSRVWPSVFDLSVKYLGKWWARAFNCVLSMREGGKKQKQKTEGGAGGQPSEPVPVEENIQILTMKFHELDSKPKSRE